MIHPRSDSAQEASRQQAAGADLLKVRTAALTKGVPAEVRDRRLLCGSETDRGERERKKKERNPILGVLESAGLC